MYWKPKYCNLAIIVQSLKSKYFLVYQLLLCNNGINCLYIKSIGVISNTTTGFSFKPLFLSLGNYKLILWLIPKNSKIALNKLVSTTVFSNFNRTQLLEVEN